MDYQLLTLTAEYAQFKYKGFFMGRDVVWNVHLHARGSPGATEITQSMDIEPSQSGATVEVNLNLAIPRLTESEIRKTIIMLRNYKRLRPGRHEWSG